MQRKVLMAVKTLTYCFALLTYMVSGWLQAQNTATSQPLSQSDTYFQRQETETDTCYEHPDFSEWESKTFSQVYCLIIDPTQDIHTPWKKLQNLQALTLKQKESEGWTIYPPLSALPKLKEVDTLRSTAIIPKGIGRLSKLTSLYAIGLGIRGLPSTLRRCRQLEVLFLSFNKLEALPSFLIKLTNLKELGLTANYSLNSVQAISVLKQMQQLRFLDLRGCGFSAQQIQKLQGELPNCEIRY